MTITGVTIERERWIRDTFSGYDPLLAHLSAEFGAPFAVEHTGGGCHTIIGHMPERLQIHLSMAVDSPSSYAEHAALEADGERAGWAVIIYGPADDYSEAVAHTADAHMSIDDHRGVAALVRESLSQVPS
ncbi:hypothetical protein [Mycobacteroides abscessus]|uniref:hypothetical protein n=1 Tax=Mycobacteroides abscessus TaxID=36809 RepID=UPI00210378DA|nr:hypothetical protein [Mycobacteroides abscessus]